jgi:hypothetical protein
VNTTSELTPSACSSEEARVTTRAVMPMALSTLETVRATTATGFSPDSSTVMVAGRPCWTEAEKPAGSRKAASASPRSTRERASPASTWRTVTRSRRPGLASTPSVKPAATGPLSASATA